MKSSLRLPFPSAPPAWVAELGPRVIRGVPALLLAGAVAAGFLRPGRRELFVLAGVLAVYAVILTSRVRKLEGELRATRASLATSGRLAALGELGGGIAHQLRNPLAVMRNWLHILHTDLPDAGEEVAHSLGRLEGEIERAERIIQDLLALAQGRQSPLEPVELGVVVHRCLARLDIPASVRVDMLACQDLRALGHAGQMEQVLSNLLENAIQAMDRRGRLSLRGHLEDGWVRLDVTDTGPGMPESVRRLVFEPLFTTKRTGTGLGLALSRRLVEAQGGRIECFSQQGLGTTFRIRLRTANGRGPGQVRNRHSPPRTRG